MIIKSAKFVRSVANVSDLWNETIPEIAIVGRSNVGKSSIINYLTNMKSLVKISSTPGRTRLVNFFDINDGQFYFVDLPGYGFAKGQKSEQSKWQSLIGGYFSASHSLRLCLLLLDIRREVSEQDRQMIRYLTVYNISFIVLVTKADKIAVSKRKIYATKIASSIGIPIQNVYICSTVAKIGKEQVLEKFEQFIVDEK